MGGRIHYAANTAPARAALQAGPAQAGTPVLPARPLPPPAAPPTALTRLYERYIGLVTPIIAEELAEAEKEFPQEWLADAFAEAAGRGKHNWRYVLAILHGWASRGR